MDPEKKFQEFKDWKIDYYVILSRTLNRYLKTVTKFGDKFILRCLNRLPGVTFINVLTDRENV